jgi:hypothetical protein
VREVLARLDGVTEADIEQELVSKAKALGIEWSGSGRCETQEEEVLAGVLDDADKEPSRAVSAGSDGTTDVGLAPRPPDQTTATSATPTEASARRRSRSISFSLYDRYISQVDPALHQPKFLRPDQGKDGTGGSVTKSGSRKGVRDFTRSIAARLKRRKPSPNLPM